ncbi:group II intron maturase-specific domain-containing protein [Paenibacillus sp. A14]|uniref:group II intron maturase-specific domain-containing protein n=2 Tax=Paenibacillus TaxID=44249 RepID=UPI002FE306AA
MKKMREKVKKETAPRNKLVKTLNDLVKELNPKIQGWKNYYSKVDPGKAKSYLREIDWYNI